ncbi:MAG: hypothetical protein ACPGVK_05060 [Halocynthiibacter sp.]
MTRPPSDDDILAPFFDAAQENEIPDTAFLTRIAQMGHDHQPVAPSAAKGTRFRWSLPPIWRGISLGAALGCAVLVGGWIGFTAPDMVQAIGDTYYGSGDSYAAAFSSDFDLAFEDT